MSEPETELAASEGRPRELERWTSFRREYWRLTESMRSFFSFIIRASSSFDNISPFSNFFLSFDRLDTLVEATDPTMD
jgi:hypothetical protein